MSNKSNIRWIDSDLGAPGPVHENSPVGLAVGADSAAETEIWPAEPGCRVNRWRAKSACV